MQCIEITIWCSTPQYSLGFRNFRLHLLRVASRKDAPRSGVQTIHTIISCCMSAPVASVRAPHLHQHLTSYVPIRLASASPASDFHHDLKLSKSLLAIPSFERARYESIESQLPPVQSCDDVTWALCGHTAYQQAPAGASNDRARIRQDAAFAEKTSPVNQSELPASFLDRVGKGCI